MLRSLQRISRKGTGVSSGALLAGTIVAVTSAGAYQYSSQYSQFQYSRCEAAEGEHKEEEVRANDDTANKEKGPPRQDGTVEYVAPKPIPAVAVFLDKGSVLKLKAHFPQALSDHLDRVILQYAPDDSQYAMYSPLFNSKAGVKVLGEGAVELLAGGKDGQGWKGKDTRALYATLTYEGEGKKISERSEESSGSAPASVAPVDGDTHVPTIVCSGGSAAQPAHVKGHGSYSSELDRDEATASAIALMLRLQQAGALNQSSFVGPVAGVEFEERCYPPAVVSYKQLISPIELQGVFCAEDGWDAQNGVCNSEQRTECAFCRFMRAGPCREVFIGFERCIKGYDPKRAKDDEEKAAITAAMVAKCAPRAAALNVCMKEHADYHAPVLDHDEGQGERTKTADAHVVKEDTETEKGREDTQGATQ